MLGINIFKFNAFEVNTYLLWDTVSLDAVVIDPGMVSAAERETFDTYVKNHDLKIIEVVNTHLHLDHCFGDNYVRDKYGVKVAANAGDAPLGEGLWLQMMRFGMKGDDNSDVEIDVPLKDGDIIEFGEQRLYVITTPGHSMGGICLYWKSGSASQPDLLIAGDTLFRGGIGRTDLEGGDHRQLIESIKNRLFTLPNTTIALPGHGPATTIGDERMTNPYVG